MNPPTARTDLPRLLLRLPGRWWQIPLTDRDDARASLHRLARAQFGSSDDRAKLRRDFENRMLDGLEAAIEGEGQSFHVAMEVVRGVPIPASITVFLPGQAMTPAIGTSPDAVLDVLERGLRQAAADRGAGDDLARIALRSSSALRLARRDRIEDSDGAMREGLIVQYWLPIPGSKRVVLVSCSTPLLGLDDTMINFFDAIARGARWDHDDARLVALLDEEATVVVDE